jgi:AI-2 transport system permease protein
MRKILPWLARWEVGLLAVLVLEIFIFGMVNPVFFDLPKLLLTMPDFIYLGIVALPLGMIMMTGGIDLSFGSVASLAAITTGVVFATSKSMVLGILVGLLVGVVCGLVNGVLIVTTKAQPMVLTLGTLFLFAGLALGVSGIGGVSAYEGIGNFPDWFNQIAYGTSLGLPNLLVAFVLASIVFYLLMSKTSFGRQMRLIGANAQTARYAGFSVSRLLITGYAVMGAMAALVGVLLSSYFGSARPDIGATLLLPVLTLVVIGGVSMFGGEGNMIGIVIATLVIGVLQQGIRYAGMNENEVSVVTGSVLVGVSILRWWSGRWSELLRNRRNRRREERAASALAGEPQAVGVGQAEPTAR